MSVQEHYACYDTPERNSSSSLVVNRGNEAYDPHSNDNEDDDEYEQSTKTQQQQPNSTRTNNG